MRRRSVSACRSSPVPDRLELTRAIENLCRALLVDMSDKTLINSVAHEFLEPRWKGLHELRCEAELLVLLLTDKAGTIVHRDTGPPLVGAVGAAAMPERAIPDERTALLHLCRNRVVLAAIFGTG